MKCKIVLLMVALVFSFSCKQSGESGKSLRMVKCSEIAIVGDYSNSALFPGKVVAACDVNLSFRVAGVIDRVIVKEGDYVKRGEVIALMDKRDYQLQLAATQAEYNAVKGEVSRIIELYETKSVTENDYEKAISGLERIEAKLESHRNALADTELKAPFNGRVQKIMFNSGEAVSAGLQIVSFVSVDSPEVVINLPAPNYILRNNIMSATATIESFPNVEFPLTLIGTAPKANLNQLYTTNFLITSINNYTPAPGMSVMVKIEYSSEPTSLLSIPFSAIFEHSGTSCVWVVVDNKVEKREVTVKEVKTNGIAFIEGDVEVGNNVVVAGVNSIKEGQSVSVMPNL